MHGILQAMAVEFAARATYSLRAPLSPCPHTHKWGGTQMCGGQRPTPMRLQGGGQPTSFTHLGSRVYGPIAADVECSCRWRPIAITLCSKDNYYTLSLA